MNGPLFQADGVSPWVIDNRGYKISADGYRLDHEQVRVIADALNKLEEDRKPKPRWEAVFGRLACEGQYVAAFDTGNRARDAAVAHTVARLLNADEDAS